MHGRKNLTQAESRPSWRMPIKGVGRFVAHSLWGTMAFGMSLELGPQASNSICLCFQMQHIKWLDPHPNISTNCLQSSISDPKTKLLYEFHACWSSSAWAGGGDYEAILASVFVWPRVLELQRMGRTRNERRLHQQQVPCVAAATAAAATAKMCCNR